MAARMTDREQRQVLEALASDESNFPRDRIAAVRALQAMTARSHELRAERARLKREDLDRELDRLMRK